jgi:hypothetical protein
VVQEIRRRLISTRLFAAALLVGAAALASPATAEPIEVAAQAVALDPERPERGQFGRLQWLGTLHLTSTHGQFGGYSGLETLAGGARLVAVSDYGHWFFFRPLRDRAGRLAGVDQAEINPMLDHKGLPFPSKGHGDAEAVRREGAGAVLVAFERFHRIVRYTLPTPGAAQAVSIPPAMRNLPGNGGIEALAVLSDGRKLMIAEDGRTPAGEAQAWLHDGKQWHELGYGLSDGYVATDAAVLPNDDVLVLERRYTVFGGVSARIMRVARGSIAPGAALRGEAVAEFAPPLKVDNMEGLAVVPEAGGGTLIYLISDDNRSGLQRTLLMLFRLAP